MTLKNFPNKVDMSSKAITVRLKRDSQLRTLCISLGQAKKTMHTETTTIQVQSDKQSVQRGFNI